MKVKISNILIVFVLSMILFLPPAAEPVNAQAGTAVDLINAVNEVRAANGLQPLQVDIVLMSIAQGHSDYQASLGYWTYEGPDGSTPKERAAAAGFGGGATVFVSENVAVVSSSASFDTLINTIWSDELHWNTMLNPSYTHAGAGITVSGSEVYYTLDTGYIAGGIVEYTPGPTYTPVVTQAAGQIEATDDSVHPVFTSTPWIDGTIKHMVEPGQSLYSIAVAYGLYINDIINLNYLDPNDPAIWPGHELLIRPSLVPSLTVEPTLTVRPPTRTPAPSNTPRPPTRTPKAEISPTPTEESLLPDVSSGRIGRKTVGVVVIIVCGIGLIAVILSSMFSRE